MKNNPPLRTIDANFNRFKEGLRVVEDILRYEYNSPLAKEIKKIRHFKLPDYEKIVLSRDAKNDILKPTISSELERKNIKDLIISNLKRAQESARVLEETYKMIDSKTSETFKNFRYKLYTLEKEILTLIH